MVCYQNIIQLFDVVPWQNMHSPGKTLSKPPTHHTWRRINTQYDWLQSQYICIHLVPGRNWRAFVLATRSVPDMRWLDSLHYRSEWVSFWCSFPSKDVVAIRFWIDQQQFRQITAVFEVSSNVLVMVLNLRAKHTLKNICVVDDDGIIYSCLINFKYLVRFIINLIKYLCRISLKRLRFYSLKIFVVVLSVFAVDLKRKIVEWFFVIWNLLSGVKGWLSLVVLSVLEYQHFYAYLGQGHIQEVRSCDAYAPFKIV